MKNIIYTIVAFFMTQSLVGQDIQPQWAFDEGGKGFDMARALVTDNKGNIYSTGNFQERATYGTTILKSSGDTDIYLAKHNESGELEWIKSAGSTLNRKHVISEYGTAITVVDDEVIIAGSFSRVGHFDKTELMSAGKSDIFIAKYSGSGELMWVKSAGGNSQDIVNDIANDDEGNIYITGYYQNNASFDHIRFENPEFTNMFIAKYDSKGNVLWVKQFEQQGNANGKALKVFNDELYLAGTFENQLSDLSNINNSNGGSDVMIAKFTLDGIHQWTKVVGGKLSDDVNDLDVNENGVYAIGSFEGEVVSGTTTLTSNGGSDAFVAKYNLKGQSIWIKSIGGKSNDIGTAIVASDDHTIIVAGNFSESLSVEETIATSKGMTDVFIGELSDSGEIMQLSSYGDEGQDNCHAIALDLNSVVLAGSITQNFTITGNESTPKAGTNSFLNKVKILSKENEKAVTNESSQYSIFPNPSAGEFTVSARFQNKIDEVHLKIHSSDGRLIVDKKYSGRENISEEIDMREQARGMYFIEILNNDKSIYNDKIVIE